MISKEQYDAYCRDLAHGRKVVRVNGRRCTTIDQLNQAIGATAKSPQADEPKQKEQKAAERQPARTRMMDLSRSSVLEQEKAGLIAERKALRESEATLKAENAELMAKADGFCDEATASKVKISDLEAENKRLANEIEALKAENAELKNAGALIEETAGTGGNPPEPAKASETNAEEAKSAEDKSPASKASAKVETTEEAKADGKKKPAQ